jgi:hypothetical protein
LVVAALVQITTQIRIQTVQRILAVAQVERMAKQVELPQLAVRALLYFVTQILLLQRLQQLVLQLSPQ